MDDFREKELARLQTFMNLDSEMIQVARLHWPNLSEEQITAAINVIEKTAKRSKEFREQALAAKKKRESTQG